MRWPTPMDNSWEDLNLLQQQYPDVDLKDKVSFNAKGNVTSPMEPIKVAMHEEWSHKKIILRWQPLNARRGYVGTRIILEKKQDQTKG